MRKRKKVLPGDSEYTAALSLARKKDFDPEEVKKLLEKSIKQGNPLAQYALATWYMHGEHVRKSLTKAVALLKMSARQNNVDALFDLAIAHEKGQGTKKNETNAAICYLRAAILGDADSAYEIGRCYYHGIGVSKDRKVARTWMDRAEELDSLKNQK